MRSNRHIASLTIEEYGKSDDFQGFVRVLCESCVEKLVFKKVTYTQKMLSILKSSISGMSIQELRLEKCSIGRRWIEVLNDHLVTYDEFPVTSLSIVKDDVLTRVEDIGVLAKFIELSNITSIRLQKVGNDVARMLSALCHFGKPFVEIDLSENTCSDGYNGSLVLPNSLRKLTLAHVKWKGSSLINLFSQQNFLSRCVVDVSAASIEDYDFPSFCDKLGNQPETSFFGRVWNENMISANFLWKISERDDIDELTCDKCTFSQSEKKTILGAMSSVPEALPLTKLSIRKTFASFKAGMMEALKTVLLPVSMSSLRILNVADNCFEDEGLQILEEILTANTNIQCIIFDGCNARRPKSLIQFLNQLREMTHITKAGKPKREIERFRESSKLGLRELIKSWNKLSESLVQRDENTLHGLECELESFNQAINSLASYSLVASEPALAAPKHNAALD